ncbi:uncharacterized protein [Apostichopus japonicus]|uniref:uncharacterized protein isoform X2 n=1 Tax=Stichopus japonicus TaxID=307972 RepID=UPI003AB74217
MEIVWRTLLTGMSFKKGKWLYLTLFSVLQTAILLSFIIYTSVNTRTVISNSIKTRKDVAEGEHSIEADTYDGAAKETKRSADVVQLMTGCPDGWPFEVVSRDENGSPLMQVCRSEKQDGNWRCAEGWLRLRKEMTCIPDSNPHSNPHSNHHSKPHIKTHSNPHSNPHSKTHSNPHSNELPRDLVKQPKYAPLSDERKLLFIHIPKAGGTSLETSFLFDDRRRALGGVYLGGHAKIKAFDQEFFRSYHKFCMIRHPCSRLISTWSYYSQNLGNHGDALWTQKFMSEASKSSFDWFVEKTLYPGGQVRVNNQVHLQPQVGMIFDDNGNLALNQVLVFENWNESINELGRRINTDVSSLRQTHILSSKHKSCREMYTPKTWHKMIELYAMDFCVLGYSTNLTEVDKYPPLNVQSYQLSQRYKSCSVKLGLGMNSAKREKESDSPNKRNLPKLVQEESECVVYTYYQPKKDIAADELSAAGVTLKAWKSAWSDAGWRPRVISENDARKHPEYMSLRTRFERLPTTNVAEYELSCFLRHVAMAAVGGGWMADYDVLPFHLPKCTKPFNRGEFTAYQLYTPCLVSANSSEYTRIARLMADIQWRDSPEIFSVNGKFHVSDMHVLQKLFKDRKIKTMRVVMEAKEIFKTPFSCERSLGYRATPTGMSKLPWAVHYSHSSLGAIRKANLSSVWPGSSWNSESLNAGIEAKRGEFMADSINYLRETCITDAEKVFP